MSDQPARSFLKPWVIPNVGHLARPYKPLDHAHHINIKKRRWTIVLKHENRVCDVLSDRRYLQKLFVRCWKGASG